MAFPRQAGAARPRRCANIETFHGKDGFEKFLARTDILVDVLPLTRDTHGILDAAAFARLPKGAYFINMARGGHVVDEALLAALDSGHLAGAALDVFNTEPLPTDHRYWTHPKVQVTPHIAGATNPRTASPGIIENIKRLRSGKRVDQHGRSEDGVLATTLMLLPRHRGRIQEGESPTGDVCDSMI